MTSQPLVWSQQKAEASPSYCAQGLLPSKWQGENLNPGSRVLGTMLAQPPKVVLVVLVLVVLWLHTQAHMHTTQSRCSQPGCGGFSWSPLPTSFLKCDNLGLGWRFSLLRGHELPSPAFCAQNCCWLTLKEEERITYCGPKSCKRFPNCSFPIWISPLASKLKQRCIEEEWSPYDSGSLFW